MSGNLTGGRKASETNRRRYGEDFYKRIGAIGGRNGHTGGFTSNPALARVAGGKGGKRSKSGLKFLREEDGCWVYLNKDGDEVRFGIGESMHGNKDIDAIERELDKDGRR